MTACLISTTVPTPLGEMLAVAAPEGLCLLEFVDRACLNAQINWLRRAWRAEIAPGSSAVIEQAHSELEEYFAGRRQSFDLPLCCSGTPFQRRVWQALRQIPYGQTRTYYQIAQAIDHPLAARAVGAANGRNPIAIIIPCHRLVGADGSLTGYGGGLWRKQHLLELEKHHS